MSYIYTNYFPTSGSTGKSLIDNLITTVSSVGYTIVETLSVNSVNWAIVKSPSSLNGKCDFFMGFGYDAGSAQTVRTCLMEDWNTSSKMATGIAPENGNEPLNADYAVATWAYLPTSESRLYNFTHVLRPLSNAKHFIWANERFVHWAAPASFTTTSTLDIGARTFGPVISVYDSFLSASLDPFPVVIWNTHQDRTWGTNYTFIFSISSVDEFYNTHGRSTRDQFESQSPDNFGIRVAALTRITYPNQVSVFNGLHMYSRAVVMKYKNNYTESIFSTNAFGCKGILRDFYFGANTNANIGNITQWTFQNSIYKASLPLQYQNPLGQSTAGWRPGFAILILEG